MRHIIVTIASVAALAADAAADPYAAAGVTELGGLVQISFAKRSFTPEGADVSLDTSTTDVTLQPVIGYFVAPRLQIIAGPTVTWNKQSSDDDADEGDVTFTAFGLRAGAGYYVPSGPILLGPRAQIGYLRGSVEAGDVELTTNDWLFQAAGALRVPFGGGGLLDLALTLDYLTGSAETTVVGMDVEADTSNLQLGLQAGVFIYF